jgi:hypothetical protein
MNLMGVECEGVNWIQLGQNRLQFLQWISTSCFIKAGDVCTTHDSKELSSYLVSWLVLYNTYKSLKVCNVVYSTFNTACVAGLVELTLSFSKRIYVNSPPVRLVTVAGGSDSHRQHFGGKNVRLRWIQSPRPRVRFRLEICISAHPPPPPPPRTYSPETNTWKKFSTMDCRNKIFCPSLCKFRA